MAVVVKNPKSSMAATFDRLHIDSFTFVQIPPANANDPIVRMAKFQGSTYAQSESGEILLSNHPVRASIMDVDPLVLGTYCAQHSKTVPAALQDLAEARAKILSEYSDGTLTDLHLMAAFELALGRLLELSGSIKVDRIE